MGAIKPINLASITAMEISCYTTWFFPSDNYTSGGIN
jgi:hypothetical protein